MFQLDEALRVWRNEVSRHGTVGVADVNELESHLRDDLDQLENRGLSEEEAFLVAAHRLGSGPELAAEYGKVNVGRLWARRLFWMLSGYMVVSLSLGTVGALGGWIHTGAMASGLAVTSGSHLVLSAVLMGVTLVTVALLALLPSGRRLLVRSGERVLSWGRYHPGILLGGAYLLYVSIRALGMGRSLVQARLFGAAAMGQAAMANAYFSLALAVVIPAVILILCGWTYRVLHRQAPVALPGS